MSEISRERTRLVLRLSAAALYAAMGAFHLRNPKGFLPIMPPQVPYPETVVQLTGVAELAGAAGLLIPQTRKAAGVGLALYALCVWPANLYHWLARRHAPPIPDSLWYHIPRQFFQPVFMWWALFAGGVIDWPWRRRPGARP